MPNKSPGPGRTRLTRGSSISRKLISKHKDWPKYSMVLWNLRAPFQFAKAYFPFDLTVRMSTTSTWRQTKSTKLISIWWNPPTRNTVCTSRKYLKLKARMLKVAYQIWTTRVGVLGAWTTSITVRPRTTRGCCNSSAGSSPSSSCIDAARIRPTYSTSLASGSTPSRNSTGYKTTHVQIARRSRRNKSVYRPKTKRRDNEESWSRSRKSSLTLQREKSRRGFIKSNKSTGGTIRDSTLSIINRKADPGKDGIINNKDGNKTRSSKTIQIPLNPPSKCGEKKWLSIREPKQWRKNSWKCYVASVKINLTRNFAWIFWGKQNPSTIQRYLARALSYLS